MGDLDRKKHDVDVIERVLGGVRETVGADDQPTRLISVEVPCGGSTRSTVELTVGLADSPDSPADDSSRGARGIDRQKEDGRTRDA